MDSAMRNSGIHQLFLDQMKDMYWAENHIVESLPQMVAAATSRQLKSALQEHLDVTNTHVKRLEKAFDSRDEKAEGKVCSAIKCLAKKGEQHTTKTEEQQK